MSDYVHLNCGVRQGGVLSPHLFAIYVDDIINKVSSSKFSCFKRFICISIFVYADDIILLSPSVSFLQELINLVEKELNQLEMSINASKSTIIRFGPRYDVMCAALKLRNGSEIPWASECQYLGKTLCSAKFFKCHFDKEKRALYKSFNALFGKIGRIASTEVIIHLLKTKCLPVLLYGLNACPVNATELKSLEFALFRILAKIFGTFSKVFIDECRAHFSLSLLSDTIRSTKLKFLMRYAASESTVCAVFAINATNESKLLY